MRDIDFRCSHCSESLKATPDMVGQEIECPACNKKVIVPTSPAMNRTDQKSSKKKTIIMLLVLLLIIWVYVKRTFLSKDKTPEKAVATQTKAVPKKKPPKLKKKVPKKKAEAKKKAEDKPEKMKVEEAELELGQTRKEVYRLRGAPGAKIKSGKKEVLYYGDCEVTLMDDVVTDIQR